MRFPAWYCTDCSNSLTIQTLSVPSPFGNEENARKLSPRGPILKGGSRYAVEVGKNGSLTTTVSLRHIDGDPIESAGGPSS